jgi:hypothetical protein
LKASLAIRSLTVAGVAIGSALLIGALALAMRGIAPVSSAAAVTPSTQKMLAAVQQLAAQHREVGKLASWHPPRVPKFHPAPPAAPRVVTITTPAQVVQTPAAPVQAAAPSVQSTAQVRTQAAPPAHESESGDNSPASGGGDD